MLNFLAKNRLSLSSQYVFMQALQNHSQARYLYAGNLDIYRPAMEVEVLIQVSSSGISAGFPSPAQDFMDLAIDLNRELIRNPSSTFYGRVRGDSMTDAGISDGDLLIIDKSMRATDGKIAVCFIDGEFTVKRIKTDTDCCWLMPANAKYRPLRVTEENHFLIWGIVIHVIKSF